MNDLSWAEISQLNNAGVAKSVFSVGDRKTISAKKLDFKYNNGNESQKNECDQTNVTTDAILVDFDKDGAGVMTFCCDEILAIIPVHCYGGWIRKHRDYAADQDRIDNNIENFFSPDLCSVLFSVSKSTADMPASTPNVDYLITPSTTTRSCKVFAPSASELGFSNEVKVSEYPTSAYSYFSNNQSRMFGFEFSSRSLQTGYASYSQGGSPAWGRCNVTSSGTYLFKYDTNPISQEFSYLLAFCIK